MYNHHLSISFEYISSDPDAEDVTYGSIMSCLIGRMHRIKDSGDPLTELKEAVLPPVDTIELNPPNPLEEVHEHRQKYGDANPYPGFSLTRWRILVLEDRIRLGYWDWVTDCIERQMRGLEASTAARKDVS